MNNITIRGAAELLGEKQKILILSHIRPDGDTLGSAFALKAALQAAGKTVNVACADEIPKRLCFISDMKTSLRKENYEGFEPEFVCAVDAAETGLLGEYGEGAAESGCIDLKLDHHPLGSEYARFNYIDGAVSATGEIIYEVIRELEAIGKGRLTPASATMLYAAISSDTGCFRYSNVTSKTMRIAAELIDAGAEHSDVCYRLFELKSVGETVAERVMLNNLNIYRFGTMAVVTVTNEMKAENGLSDEDLGGIASKLRQIEGIQLAVSIRQSSEDYKSYKISMRSGPSVSAARLCALFGGGGHERAAGAEINADSPQEAENRVVSSVMSELEKAMKLL